MECVLNQQVAALCSCLAAPCLSAFRVASQGCHCEITPCAVAQSEQELQNTVADEAVRQHYRELLGVDDAIRLLHRRQWLLSVDASTTYAQWRTHTAVARLMNGVPLDGVDLFAALRRAYLASQVPALADSAGVVRWMHVLDAVEETDPVQAQHYAAEAWRALAHTVTAHSFLWAAQTAHFLSSMSDLHKWLLADEGIDAQKLHSLLEALEGRLESTPSFGQYGPKYDSHILRARHVAKLKMLF